ncbi:MAG: alpha/beta fold hydrolase [Bdellovibrionales bacterium]
MIVQRSELSQSTAKSFFYRDGAKIWFKVKGRSEGPPLFFIHGGPGYSCYSFEHGIGPTLEEQLKMVYFDQRGCGRSMEVESDAPVDMTALVEDLEALRKITGISKINLLGHSFGGLIALEYLRAYPQHVGKIILLESTAKLNAILEHQVAYLAEVSVRAFPQHTSSLVEIAKSTSSLLDKLVAIYQLLEERALLKELFWYQGENMYRHIALDVQSGLFFKTGSRLVFELEKSGYLESDHPELMQKLTVPAILFAGRHSQCAGEINMNAAARSWGVPLVWFEQSGHLPYAEEPQAFAEAVFKFILPRPSGS